VVYPILESAVCVGESFRAATEAHLSAEVISAFNAIFALVAHDSSFDGDPLPWNDICYAGAYCGDEAGGLVAENDWVTDGELANLAVLIVMKIATA
jgi:hypothetical protein